MHLKIAKMVNFILVFLRHPFFFSRFGYAGSSLLQMVLYSWLGGCSLVAVHGLLTAEVSLLEERGLSGKRVSAVAAPGL